MSKIIVTLKEPISDGKHMNTVLEFDTYEILLADNVAGVLEFLDLTKKVGCPIPVSNILGVTYKVDLNATP